MNEVLARFNRLSAEEAAQEILPCCGSTSWARAVAMQRPINDATSLLAVSDEAWRSLEASDWMEAFTKHPRIGERTGPLAASAQSAAWSAQEQRNVADAGESVQLALAEGNRQYERRFDRVFIVCATARSAPEILEILGRRLRNDDSTELREAAEEQRKITNIRLRKWLLG
jgi:2-oxo-4-hydroxy-4-carboxy-5-ureidoimidazoline decarboxylase